MENIIQVLDKNLLIGLLVLLVIFPVYYKMGLLNWITGRSNGKENTDLSSQMTKLREHYNHDTTRDLQSIIQKQDLMHDSLKNIENRLNNFETFGIKIRKE